MTEGYGRSLAFATRGVGAGLAPALVAQERDLYSSAFTAFSKSP